MQPMSGQCGILDRPGPSLPGEWYNAIGAFLVAPIDGVDPSGDLALPPRCGDVLGDLHDI